MAMTPSDIVGPAPGAWTYNDYLALSDDGRRYEIIAGVLNAAPTPDTDHQTTVGEIHVALYNELKKAAAGRVFIAPYDVRLNVTTVLQPDVVVVLTHHLDRIGRRGVDGAPDLVVEVVSPGTATYDRDYKRHAYERAGVPEYWIVDPGTKTVELFILDGDCYLQVGVYEGDARVPTRVIDGLDIPVRSLFS